MFAPMSRAIFHETSSVCQPRTLIGFPSLSEIVDLGSLRSDSNHSALLPKITHSFGVKPSKRTLRSSRLSNPRTEWPSPPIHSINAMMLCDENCVNRIPLTFLTSI